MSSSFEPQTPLEPLKYAFVLPGITPEAKQLSEHLLEKNHVEHDIFFNPKGFHNHLTHHYLSAYAMGANPERLQAIYDEHASYQRPLPSSVGELNRENYRAQIGNRNAYTSYRDMFQREINQHGMINTIRHWIYSDDLLARVVGGAYHPIIHIGYGVEFNLPALAAEGLAMAACTEARFADFVPHGQPADSQRVLSTARDMVSQLTTGFATRLNLGKPQSGDAPSASSLTAVDMDAALKEALNNNAVLDLAEEIRRDTDFDDVVKYSDENKITAVLESEKAKDKLRTYLSRWSVSETEQDVWEKLKELYTASMVIYGASAIRKQGIKLDFFLVHALTSIHAIHTLIPHLSYVESVKLLKAHAAATLTYFVSLGRPSLQLDLLLKFQSPEFDTKCNNPWLSLCDRAITAHEAHQIKAIHSLAVGQMLYAHDSPLAKAWIRVADLTLYVSDQEKKAGGADYWNRSGIGYDEDWEDTSGLVPY